MKKGPQQRVVVYTDDEGRNVVYAAGYTDEQVDEFMRQCALRHGRDSNVRSRRA